MLLIKELRQIPVSEIPDANTLLYKINSGAASPFLLVGLLKQWQPLKDNFKGTHVATMLAAAVKTRIKIMESAVNADLVWTGPHQPAGNAIRATLSVIREMIDKAKYNICVVGYYIAADSEPVKTIIKALSKATQRGCNVTLVFNNDGCNHQVILAMWPPNVRQPAILLWNNYDNIKHASLHAKIIAVDDNDLLITSANLTEHGMIANIEMGIRINGVMAKAVTSHFRSLQRSGILINAK